MPPSVRQTDAASALGEFTLPPMLREAVNVLGIHGVVDRSADGRPSQEDELSLALASMWPDAPAAPVDRRPDGHIAAPVAATAANPRFMVIPQVTRGMARRATAPPTEEPRPQPAAKRGRRQGGKRNPSTPPGADTGGTSPELAPPAPTARTNMEANEARTTATAPA